MTSEEFKIWRRAYMKIWRSKNREKINASHKKWMLEHPDYVPNHHRNRDPAAHRKHQRTYKGCINATGETKYGPCEICNKVEKLAFDHDHTSGLFRGWLCHQCNTSLGHYETWYLKYQEVIDKYTNSVVKTTG